MKFTRSRVPREAVEFQERIAAAFAALEGHPLYGAKMIDVPDNANGRAFDAAVDTDVAHKLGRKIVGFSVVYQDGAANLRVSTATTAKNDDRLITLISDSNIPTCKILFF